MFHNPTEESGLFIDDYLCNLSLMLFLTWISGSFRLPPSCSKQKHTSWLPNVKKGQRQNPLLLLLWEVWNNPTANILQQWLATVSLGCLCDGSLICHYCLFPTWINVYSPHRQQPHPPPVCPLNLRGKVTPAAFFLVQHIPPHLLFVFQRHMAPSNPPTSLCDPWIHYSTVGRAVPRVTFWCKAKVVLQINSHHPGAGSWLAEMADHQILC